MLGARASFGRWHESIFLFVWGVGLVGVMGGESLFGGWGESLFGRWPESLFGPMAREPLLGGDGLRASFCLSGSVGLVGVMGD